MSAVIHLGTFTNVRSIAAVRDAVNERARFIGATDDNRRHAVNAGIQAVTGDGRSAGWAISHACRLLQGKPAVVHGGYPNGPEAA